MFFPIIRYLFIEVNIIFLSNILWFSHPNRNSLIDSLKFMSNFLDFLSLLLFLFFFFLSYFQIIFFFLFIFFLFLSFSLFISDIFLSCLFSIDLNWELDKLRVNFDKIFNLFLLKIFKTFWFKV